MQSTTVLKLFELSTHCFELVHPFVFESVGRGGALSPAVDGRRRPRARFSEEAERTGVLSIGIAVVGSSLVEADARTECECSATSCALLSADEKTGASRATLGAGLS